LERVRQFSKLALLVDAMTLWGIIIMASHNRHLSLKGTNFAPLELIAALILTGFVLGLIMSWIYYGERSSDTSSINIGNNISSCINKYYKEKTTDDTNVNNLYQFDGFCYNSQVAQLILEEEAVRRDNFVFQRAENIALLVMVISITISGVALAGLQLFASYKLASSGKGNLADGGEATFKSDSIIVKSSVVGVVILAISFAFFIVFVVDVYTLKDTGDPGPANSRNDTQSSGMDISKQLNANKTPMLGLNPPFNLSPAKK
jgi:lysylphosphatidylglycerol synthetase-like protein (DUF2156 family)